MKEVLLPSRRKVSLKSRFIGAGRAVVEISSDALHRRRVETTMRRRRDKNWRTSSSTKNVDCGPISRQPQNYPVELRWGASMSFKPLKVLTRGLVVSTRRCPGRLLVRAHSVSVFLGLNPELRKVLALVCGNPLKPHDKLPNTTHCFNPDWSDAT